MPSYIYPLEADGENRLKISWEGRHFHSATLHLGDKEVARLGDRQALLAGTSVALPDGSEIFLRLVRCPHHSDPFIDFQVDRDGVPVPGSAMDPHAQIRGASTALHFIAGLHLLTGLVVSLLGAPLFAGDPDGIGLFAFALLFLLLGILTQRGFAQALVLGTFLFTCIGVLVIVHCLSHGFLFLLPSVLTVFFLQFLARGIAALWQRNRDKDVVDAELIPDAEE